MYFYDSRTWKIVRKFFSVFHIHFCGFEIVLKSMMIMNIFIPTLVEIFSRDFGKNSFKSLHNSKLLPNSNEKEFRMSFSFSCRKLSQNSNVYMNSSKL